MQSLQRGLAVLDFLVESGGPVRTSDVADRFDIDKANASRLLADAAGRRLCRAGRQTAATRSARKFNGEHGSRQLEGLIALRERARSLLEGLVEASGECAHMAVLVADKVWYIDKISSPHALRVDHPVGALAPLHCTALGKAYLAFGRASRPATFARFTAQHHRRSRRARRPTSPRRAVWATPVDDEEFSPGRPLRRRRHPRQ